MKLSKIFVVFFAAFVWLGSSASAQTPAISSISVKGCTYTVGVSKTTCAVAPGMTLVINGTNFGSSGGTVNTCDCPQIIVPSGKWTNTKITGFVYQVHPNWSAGIQVETSGGTFSAAGAVPYTALAAVITSLKVGSCTYIPGVSATQCLINPGTEFTITGNYFGPGPLTSGPQIAMCDCTNATINSWDPGWVSNPAATGNEIVAIAVAAECGNSIVVFAQDTTAPGSNPVPYTTCSN